MITAERPELVELFAGIPPRAFRKLVATVARRGRRQVADGVNGRQWSLPLADRVLLVATYYRTNWRCGSSRRCSTSGQLRYTDHRPLGP